MFEFSSLAIERSNSMLAVGNLDLPYSTIFLIDLPPTHAIVSLILASDGCVGCVGCVVVFIVVLVRSDCVVILILEDSFFKTELHFYSIDV